MMNEWNATEISNCLCGHVHEKYIDGRKMGWKPCMFCRCASVHPEVTIPLNHTPTPEDVMDFLAGAGLDALKIVAMREYIRNAVNSHAAHLSTIRELVKVAKALIQHEKVQGVVIFTMDEIVLMAQEAVAKAEKLL